jgi:hypothetical protein
MAEASTDFFDCSFCGARHDLARDRAAIASGKFRWPVDKNGPPALDHVVLIRAFRYRADHAKRAVREIAENAERQTPNSESRIQEEAAAR